MLLGLRSWVGCGGLDIIETAVSPVDMIKLLHTLGVGIRMPFRAF